MYIVRVLHPDSFRESNNHFIIPVTSSSFNSIQTYLYLIAEHQFEMAATQRALLVQEIGKPLVLVNDHPILEPGNGQVQIKVTVAGKSY
jgi:hypothetical protein